MQKIIGFILKKCLFCSIRITVRMLKALKLLFFQIFIIAIELLTCKRKYISRHTFFAVNYDKFSEYFRVINQISVTKHVQYKTLIKVNFLCDI